MADGIKGMLNKILTTTGGLTCIIALSLLVVAFLLCLAFVVFRAEYGLKSRAWFFLSCVGIGLLQTGIGMLFNAVGYGLIVFGVGFLLSSIIVGVPKKRNKKTIEMQNGIGQISEGQRAFVKYLTEKAGQKTKEVGFKSTENESETEKTQTGNLPPRSIEVIEKVVSSPVKKAQTCSQNTDNNLDKGRAEMEQKGGTQLKNNNNADELNFSHVKNVISRLEYFNLTPTDLRQVRELELNLLQAERGERDDELRIKINTGLSALLKIMSKYGA